MISEEVKEKRRIRQKVWRDKRRAEGKVINASKSSPNKIIIK